MANFLSLIQRLWRRLPFRHVLAATALLSIIGEQYPFSNFPMYSSLGDESDVLYVTDQADNPLPMHTLFGTSTSTQKKVFMTELKAICNPKDRDTSDALPEERSQAGAALMEKLFPRLKRHELDELGRNVTALKIYYKVFQLEAGDIAGSKPMLVAERSL